MPCPLAAPFLHGRSAAPVPLQSIATLTGTVCCTHPAPQAAYARRGAPWTFDGRAFVEAVRRIKQQGRALLPSFDHGMGDPVEGDILIDAAQHAVVLVSEGQLTADGCVPC